VIALTPSPLGVEALDDPRCPPLLARRTLEDIARANRLFGGRGAPAFALDLLLRDAPAGRLTLLDVGAGGGDVARALVARARRRGTELVVIAADRLRAAADLCREARVMSVVASAGALPLRDGSVDVVLASQFLHHFSREAAAELVRAFDRLARVGVIVSEPRRSPFAAAGIWLAALALGFHRVTRHDGVLSVRRSFRRRELQALLARAGVDARVHRRPGFRLVAAWRTPRAHG
jgi:SAM-dependent methyltransferase